MSSNISLPRKGCAATIALNIIEGKWKPYIIYQLQFETRRFNELKKMIPTITQRMLTRSLRELEKDGVVERIVYPEIPPRVEYLLTPLGLGLEGVFSVLSNWGKSYLAHQPVINEESKNERPTSL